MTDEIRPNLKDLIDKLTNGDIKAIHLTGIHYIDMDDGTRAASPRKAICQIDLLPTPGGSQFRMADIYDLDRGLFSSGLYIPLTQTENLLLHALERQARHAYSLAHPFQRSARKAARDSLKWVGIE